MLPNKAIEKRRKGNKKETRIGRNQRNNQVRTNRKNTHEKYPQIKMKNIQSLIEIADGSS